MSSERTARALLVGLALALYSGSAGYAQSVEHGAWQGCRSGQVCYWKEVGPILVDEGKTPSMSGEAAFRALDARAFVSVMIAEADTVVLEEECEWQGYLVADVVVDDTLNLGLEMVRRGLARRHEWCEER